MSRFRRSLIVALGVAALAIPAGATAQPGASHGQGKANGHVKVHNVAYVFKGVYVGSTANEGTVEIKAGNAHVKKAGLVGTTVSFDFSKARIVVADTNGDTKQNLEDVKAGDKVLVQAMLPRKNPGTQPFAAKRLVDQTNAPS